MRRTPRGDGQNHTGRDTGAMVNRRWPAGLRACRADGPPRRQCWTCRSRRSSCVYPIGRMHVWLPGKGVVRPRCLERDRSRLRFETTVLRCGRNRQLCRQVGVLTRIVARRRSGSVARCLTTGFDVGTIGPHRVSTGMALMSLLAHDRSAGRIMGSGDSRGSTLNPFALGVVSPRPGATLFVVGTDGGMFGPARRFLSRDVVCRAERRFVLSRRGNR